MTESIQTQTARNRHVNTMLSLPSRQARADYLEAVERSEGADAAQRLKEQFGRAWTWRKQGA